MLRHVKWVLIFAFVAGFSPNAAFTQGGDKEYRQGVKSFEDNKYEEALKSFELALKKYTKAKDKPGQANAHNYQGLTLQLLNQHNSAVGHFLSAAKLFVQNGNKSGAASAFANLGISHYRVLVEQHKQAGKPMTEEVIGEVLGYHLKAKTLHNEIGDMEGVGDDYINIANMYIAVESYEKALKYLDQAVTIHAEIQYMGGLAYDLSNLGLIYYRIGINDSAIKYYKRGISIFEALGNEEELWQAYFNLAQIYQESNKKKTAIKYLKKSVENIEELKSNFSDDKIFQSFLKNKIPVYNRLIKLLKEAGDTKEAFEYIERSKAKLSNGVLSAGKIEVAEGQKEVDKVQELQKENDELKKMLAAEKAKPIEKQDKAKIDNLSNTLGKNQGEFNTLMIDLETKYPNIYSVIKVDPIQLSDLQQHLTDDMVLLQYFPASDAVYIFLITKDKVEAKSVPVSQHTLDSLVQKFRYYMSETPSLLRRGRFDAGMKDWTESGSDARFQRRYISPLKDILVQLYDYLILPAWETIKDPKIKNLTIIPAGSLYYIPFQALATETNDGDLNFLIEKKAVTYLTAATLMDLVSKKERVDINSVLLFGNPDGSLPGAEEEAKAIKTSYGGASLFMNKDATKDKAKNMAAQYDVVHFATHGFLSGEKPQNSFVLMAPNATAGEDDKLTISDILRLPLKNKNELVVLSACNTAMGENPTGVELISLSRAFAIAGAPTTVATLWPVDDTSTKTIMINFYKGLKGGLSKAVAMQQAQIALLRQGDYHVHPFFWAPYIMIGNYR